MNVSFPINYCKFEPCRSMDTSKDTKIGIHLIQYPSYIS